MASVLTETTDAAFRERLLLGVSDLNDEDLLGRFLAEDESDSQDAFRELVNRHGPMVLGVCRHILDNAHDAEDAFQATFVVLARHSRAIRNRLALGTWLYEVAYRIAIRARARSVRRRMQERKAASMVFAGEGQARDGLGSEIDPAWTELRPILHEEINQLPEKYRSAVVLCYLEGRTNEEAAEMLKWPTGTVKGRLSRARELLRSRLARRGFGLSATFLAMAFSRNAVFAEVVPWRLAARTAQTVLAAMKDSACAAGAAGSSSMASASPSISPSVLELADDASSLLTRAATQRAMTQWILAGVAMLLFLVALYVAFVGNPSADSSGRGGPQVAFPNKAVLPTGSKAGGRFAVPAIHSLGGSQVPVAHQSSCFETSRDQ